MGRRMSIENAGKPYRLTSFKIEKKIHQRLREACAVTEHSASEIINAALRYYLGKKEDKWEELRRKAREEFPGNDEEEGAFDA